MYWLPERAVVSYINKYLETIPKSLVANEIFSIDFSELG